MASLHTGRALSTRTKAIPASEAAYQESCANNHTLCTVNPGAN